MSGLIDRIGPQRDYLLFKQGIFKQSLFSYTTVKHLIRNNLGMNMTPYPKISIITPSYNQGKFLETTIKSVFDQQYPNLEYIIMDGGSTDGSVGIIKKYSDRLTYWESGPDNGQCDAIKRGFELSHGDILAYINSDDYYLPGTFFKVAEEFMKKPSPLWITGNGIFIDTVGNTLHRNERLPPVSLNSLIFFGNYIFQPSTFWKREIYSLTTGLDTSLEFSFDYDLFLKFIQISPPNVLRSNLAAFRMHPDSKSSTISHISTKEMGQIIEVHKKEINFFNHYLYGLLGIFYRKMTKVLQRL